MRLSILADETIKDEFLQKNIPATVEISWKTTLEELVDPGADAYFDLLFVNDPARIEALKKLPVPVYINAVTDTLEDIGQPFIRINAWPDFLNRNLTEIVAGDTTDVTALDALGWKYQRVPDVPGMIAPRVIAMIINEAYFALGEKVSTKEEIDIAMKLGTNYPFGPFEWAEKIGVDKIAGLLTRLSVEDERYTMAKALVSDAALQKNPS
ncbi:MAG TPA: 3-hydroxyacyl-CoA dehydrogenase family protein [Chitinophagaceae bacterium]|nr:3-hydroxyacyl-CoA dehydrogenase family protein [Chitinophagaceae bacterium]